MERKLAETGFQKLLAYITDIEIYIFYLNLGSQEVEGNWSQFN